MKIFLIRHGEKQKIESTDPSKKYSVGLTELGKHQIETLANHLTISYPGLINLNHIYSSPFPRAIQTSEILKLRLNINKIEVNQVLSELYPTDNYSLSKEIRNDMFRAAMDNIDLIPENKIPFRTKIEEFISFLRQQYPSETTLLISGHGALIRNTVYYLFPELKPPRDIILESGLHNGGLTILDFDGQNFQLDKFDQFDFL